MNKILRFSFVALLALISSMSFAQTTVTFIAGTDNGSLSDSNKSGADEVTKDGITIATSNGLFAAVNGSSKAGEYRVYKSSTFTVTSTVGNITKVVVTCTANGDTKFGPGEFTGATSGEYTFESEGATGTWNGDAATFSLTASKNQVRMTKVEVTYSPNGTTPVTVTAPTVSGETTFTENTTVTITVPENTTVYYTTDGTEPNTASTKYTAPFTLSETTTVKAAAFDKDGNKSQVVSKVFTKQAATTGKGTLDDPYTAADVLALTALPSDSVYVQGTVVADAAGTSYKNANFYISADGTETGQLEVYRGRYVDNADFTSDITLKAGTVVLVKGKVSSYNSKNEMAQGSYIVKIISEPTNINNIKAETNADAPLYNLAGQRVSKSYKGVVIKNGKKVLVK